MGLPEEYKGLELGDDIDKIEDKNMNGEDGMNKEIKINNSLDDKKLCEINGGLNIRK
jgi:hypothetical protein